MAHDVLVIPLLLVLVDSLAVVVFFFVLVLVVPKKLLGQALLDVAQVLLPSLGVIVGSVVLMSDHVLKLAQLLICLVDFAGFFFLLVDVKLRVQLGFKVAEVGGHTALSVVGDAVELLAHPGLEIVKLLLMLMLHISGNRLGEPLDDVELSKLGLGVALV